jgi:hypothetical protein
MNQPLIFLELIDKETDKETNYSVILIKNLGNGPATNFTLKMLAPEEIEKFENIFSSDQVYYLKKIDITTNETIDITTNETIDITTNETIDITTNETIDNKYLEIFIPKIQFGDGSENIFNIYTKNNTEESKYKISGIYDQGSVKNIQGKINPIYWTKIILENKYWIFLIFIYFILIVFSIIIFRIFMSNYYTNTIIKELININNKIEINPEYSKSFSYSWNYIPDYYRKKRFNEIDIYLKLEKLAEIIKEREKLLKLTPYQILLKEIREWFISSMSWEGFWKGMWQRLIEILKIIKTTKNESRSFGIFPKGYKIINHEKLELKNKECKDITKVILKRIKYWDEKKEKKEKISEADQSKNNGNN